jgi:hypothetical protein
VSVELVAVQTRQIWLRPVNEVARASAVRRLSALIPSGVDAEFAPPSFGYLGPTVTPPRMLASSRRRRQFALADVLRSLHNAWCSAAWPRAQRGPRQLQHPSSAALSLREPLQLADFASPATNTRPFGNRKSDNSRDTWLPEVRNGCITAMRNLLVVFAELRIGTAESSEKPSTDDLWVRW